MKFSGVISHVIILKCSDVSKTNSIPIFRVLGSDTLPVTLKMGMELVLETSEHFDTTDRPRKLHRVILLFSAY
jgi:hypothetical protein